MEKNCPDQKLEALANAWIRFHEIAALSGQDSKEAKAFFWAYEEFDALCDENLSQAIDLVRRILDLTQNDFVLANLAAGPLEDILCRHGPEMISKVELLAKRDPRFRQLLRGVWRNTIDEHVWKKLQIAAASE